ncbi:peptide chain release factor N(5)-glutamine methyltransferase [Natroniella sulfidigena]|uniref:peptide chain release factor N(5)-glutamine methyltransferase n=1 Tax=Natroniella sulfidigena TaxID=723921 RepID=UPI00200B178C|nr:peptide chain release factor N(5)-glutamine methyltransferase [Natroniella sulfidigena]MCK8816411.1 peptide chain release factor N(5)-glutamine methyltransferase [Natroniella sulfidigena]
MEQLTVKDLLDKTTNFFKEHELDTPRLDAEILLAEVLELERIKLYVNFDQPLEKSEVDRYRELVVSRSKGIPVAYLVGNQEFMSLEFKVTPDVLIPRPETEHLVETALELIAELDQTELKIADVGTGSGAIIISLVKLATKDLTGVGIDISEQALKIAQKNAIKHQVKGKIDFRLGDLLEPLDDRVDLIVSNPPYIPTGQLSDLQQEVKAEPMLALDGGAEGLDYYYQIIKQATTKLRSDGLILLEVGINQARKVAEMLKEFNFKEIEIIEDYSGIERIVKASYVKE